MLFTLLIGLAMVVFSLVLQALFITICLRRFARFRLIHQGHQTLPENMVLLTIVLLLMSLANFVQITMWAALFMLLGEFEKFATALYHSGVNFAGLGYGDIVMTERWRLLGPIEAANGIIMFGISTAAMTAALIDIYKHDKAER